MNFLTKYTALSCKNIHYLSDSFNIFTKYCKFIKLNTERALTQDYFNAKI